MGIFVTLTIHAAAGGTGNALTRLANILILVKSTRIGTTYCCGPGVFSITGIFIITGRTDAGSLFNSGTRVIGTLVIRKYTIQDAAGAGATIGRLALVVTSALAAGSFFKYTGVHRQVTEG